MPQELVREAYICPFPLAEEGAPLSWRPSAVAAAGNGPDGPAPTQSRQAWDGDIPILLKLRREPLQAGLDFAHEVQRASHADHVCGLRLTACLRQGHHRVRLNLDRDAIPANHLCQSVWITRAWIVEVGHNHLMRHGSQGGNHVSDSFILGQAKDERYALTRKQLGERLPQADGCLDRMRTVQQDPGRPTEDFHTPLPAHACQTLSYMLLRDRPALLLKLDHHR